MQQAAAGKQIMTVLNRVEFEITGGPSLETGKPGCFTSFE
jgi:hypothetical protein